MNTNFLLIIAIALLLMFFFFGLSDCKSCCNDKNNSASTSRGTEGFCGVEGSAADDSLYIRHPKPSYYGWGSWGFHYGEPYYYNKITFTNY